MYDLEVAVEGEGMGAQVSISVSYRILNGQYLSYLLCSYPCPCFMNVCLVSKNGCDKVPQAHQDFSSVMMCYDVAQKKG